MIKVVNDIGLSFPVLNSNNFLFYYKDSVINFKHAATYVAMFSTLNRISSIFSYYSLFHKRTLSNVVLKFRKFINISNRKLRTQKGSGRARIGSGKSPLFKGGATTFIYKGRFRSIRLLKRRYKSILFYLLVNKRVNVLVPFMFSCIHRFGNYYEWWRKELRIKGVKKGISVFSPFSIINNFFESVLFHKKGSELEARYIIVVI